MTFLNVIWPAIYISEEIQKFWFLIFFTIVIETITVYAFLKIDWKKSALISTIGNIIILEEERKAHLIIIVSPLSIFSNLVSGKKYSGSVSL